MKVYNPTKPCLCAAKKSSSIFNLSLLTSGGSPFWTSGIASKGLAPAELSALLRLFKRRDRSNRLREPVVSQHEEVTQKLPEMKGTREKKA